MAELSTASPASPDKRAAVLALVAGAILFVIGQDVGTHPQYAAGLLGLVALIPRIRLATGNLIGRLDHPSAKVKALVAGVLFVVSARYFILTASIAGREFIPTFHDEHMYLLQARMLAGGRLWMPAHEVGEFFESFNVIVKPVYAATYFPGTALFYVPGVWIHTAPWATSILIAAGVVTLMYAVISRMLGGLAGITAATLTVSSSQFRGISVMAMSHPALILLFLLTGWSYLRWRECKALGWALAIGALMGWAGITRPLDAVCLLAPMGIAMAWDARTMPYRSRLTTVAILMMAALPFIGLQLSLNRAATGSLFHTPFGKYAEVNFPGLRFGGADLIPNDSASSLPQVRDYYRQFLKKDLLRYRNRSLVWTWWNDRVRPAADVSLPGRLLLILLPIGLISSRDPTRVALVSGALLLTVAYALYPSYLRHYGLAAAPASIALVLMGEATVRRAFPRVGHAVLLAIMAIALCSIPEIRCVPDGYMHAPFLSDINTKLANLEHTPAVVLFHYESGLADVHEEPVYNLDTAWPDDANVIRAQDLGSENHRIFEYYARREPGRFFYRYDRTTGELTALGWAKDLAVIR